VAPHTPVYLRAVADNPDFVGAHWFQYIDEPLTGRTLDGENAHVGFVTVADLPYVDLVAAARDGQPVGAERAAARREPRCERVSGRFRLPAWTGSRPPVCR